MDTDTVTLPRLAESPSCALAGRLLDNLTRRDFDALAAGLAPDVRFRALVPSGIVALDNAGDVAAKFAAWFGGSDEFEVVDASVGRVGTRLALRWRVRMWPVDRPAASRVAEQHVYLSGTDRLDSMDLLCSGFHSELLERR